MKNALQDFLDIHELQFTPASIGPALYNVAALPNIFLCGTIFDFVHPANQPLLEM